jgi:hypothetical protein
MKHKPINFERMDDALQEMYEAICEADEAVLALEDMESRMSAPVDTNRVPAVARRGT